MEMSEIVYRFIPVYRLWEIIASKKLFFMRNSKWDDPFEGYLVKEWCKVNKKNPEEFNDKKYFLCCTKAKEKDFIWKTYTPNRDGVRLSIFKEELTKIPEIKYNPIGYREDESIRKIKEKGFQNLNILPDAYYFFKRFAFENEEEVRFLIEKDGANTDVISITIEPLKIIKSIKFDPRMTREVFELQKTFIEKHLPGISISQSNLYDPKDAFK